MTHEKFKKENMTIPQLRKQRISILNDLAIEKNRHSVNKEKVKILTEIEKELSDELIKRFNQ